MHIVDESVKNNEVLAIHCLTGLGRSPLLAALALIFKFNMSREEAIEHIKNVRPGSIGLVECDFIMTYKNKNSLKNKIRKMALGI